MRISTTSESKSILYPEQKCFAFNREYFRLQTAKELVTVEFVRMESSEVVHSVIVESSNGVVEFDLSYWLQSMFKIKLTNIYDIDSFSNTNIDVEVRISSGVSLFNFRTLCIWGGLSQFETFPIKNREFTLPSNYHTLFSLFWSGQDIYRSVDDGQFVKVIPNIAYDIDGIYNFTADLTGAERQVVYAIGGTFLDVTNVFDTTFDMTFRNSAGMAAEMTIKIFVDNCQDGILLKWIDRQGLYNMFLFSQRSLNYKSSKDGDKIGIQHLNFNNISRQNKKEQQVINAYAHLANAGDFENILSLFTSPIVWMSHENNWIPVIVDTQDNVDGGAILQDINVNILLPESQIQNF